MIYRELQLSDKDEYLTLIRGLSAYDIVLTCDEFKQRVSTNNCAKTFVLCNKNNTIIGCGTIFILHKIHCNPIGFIQDVYIDAAYRNQGLGKQLIEELKTYGTTVNCYKVILNCNEYNVDFYNKCGFEKAGVEMRHDFN